LNATPPPSTVDTDGLTASRSGARALAHRPVLFVSDGLGGKVYLYSVSELRHIGTIKGFIEPEGECSDTKGDVWITDTGSLQIFEYSHSGVKEKTLSDTLGSPAGCAWDSTTGDLAVMNLYGQGGTAYPGSVLIYKHASGTPHAYTTPGEFKYYFGGYDTKGNLYFDGRQFSSGTFMLSKLPKDAKQAQLINVTGGTIYTPGLVEWNAANNQLDVGDQTCGSKQAACVYALSVVKGKGKIKQTTTLDGVFGDPVCDMVQGTIYNGTLYGSDACGSLEGITYEWSFPAGGNPIASTLYRTLATLPIGAAISK
jgi:hypothetical protein